MFVSVMTKQVQVSHTHSAWLSICAGVKERNTTRDDLSCRLCAGLRESKSINPSPISQRSAIIHHNSNQEWGSAVSLRGCEEGRQPDNLKIREE